MRFKTVTAFSILLIAPVFFIFQGCKKYKKGVLEIRKTYSFYKPTDGLYSCIVLDESNSYEGMTSGKLYEPDPSEYVYKSEITSKADNYTYKEYHVYWEDRSAQNLGYKEKNKNNPLVPDVKVYYQNKDGGEKPGENGYWADIKNSNSSNSSSGNCSGTYSSPVDPSVDAQLDSFCGAAYAYRCQDGKSLNDASVKYVCDTYNQMKEPGTPDCPYCK